MLASGCKSEGVEVLLKGRAVGLELIRAGEQINNDLSCAGDLSEARLVRTMARVAECEVEQFKRPKQRAFRQGGVPSCPLDGAADLGTNVAELFRQ